MTIEKKQKRSISGLTLIELLAVMAIMLILATVTLVSYRGFVTGTAVGATANQLRQTFLLARQTAIVNNKDVYVYFEDNWYVTVIMQGEVTYASGSSFRDEYNPELGSLATNSMLYYLNYPNAKRSDVIRDVEEITTNVFEITLRDNILRKGDTYGLEARQTMRLPRDFAFTNNSPKLIKFNPDGTSSTGTVTFVEEIRPDALGKVTVNGNSRIEVELPGD